MENNKYTAVFLELIEKGNTAAGLITEADRKAIAYAELAKAIAMSGLLNHGVIEACDIKTDQTVEPAEEVTSKESIKKGAGKKKAATKTKEEKIAPLPAPAEEEVEVEVPLPVPEEQEAEAAGETWTDATEKQFKQELIDLNWYVENWTKEYVYNDCVPAFFEDAKIIGADNIRPSNIVAFITYLYKISQTVE